MVAFESVSKVVSDLVKGVQSMEAYLAKRQDIENKIKADYNHNMNRHENDGKFATNLIEQYKTAIQVLGFSYEEALGLVEAQKASEEKDAQEN